MTNSNRYQSDIRQDRYGLRVATRLSHGLDSLPHDVTERLKAARAQALSRRKVSRQVPASAAIGFGGVAVLGAGDDQFGWWNRIASALPLVLLMVGLVTISMLQDEYVVSELAAVDAALLVDDLPPAAYADPGFVRFIQIGKHQAP